MKSEHKILLNHGRIYILPSLPGLFYFLVIFILLIVCINYQMNLGFIVTFFLMGAAFVMLIQSYLNMVGLNVSLATIPPVFAGERARIPILLSATSGREYESLQFRFNNEDFRLAQCYQSTTIALQCDATERGLQKLAPIKISTQFPGGLFNAWSNLKFNHTFLVYPQPAEADVVIAALVKTKQSQLLNCVEGFDFNGLREYHQGDSMRRIAWKTVAAGRGWFSKEFVADQQNEIWLDWDQFHSIAKERSIRIFTRLIIDLEARGVPYGLRVPTGEFKPKTGVEHHHQCLTALALMP